MKTKTSQAGNRGFTLLELVIVLFIIGLAVSVVIFSTGRLRDKTRFNEEARKISQTIKHARGIAILERKNIAFKINEDNNKYWIDYGDDKITSIHSLPPKFTVEGKTIFFFPKGNSSGGSLKINNGNGQEYEIEVDPVLGTPSIKRF